MKKTLIIMLIMTIITIITAGIMGLIKYNEIVKSSEEVNSAFSQIESNIQRKMDLLPNVIKVVKSYSKHETDLLTKITKLRSGNKSIEDLENANNKINKALININAVVEKYPELKSSEQYLSLQAQLEGSENRINITRMNYNEVVKNYNSLIKQTPGNIIAKEFNFTEKPYFKKENKEINLDI